MATKPIISRRQFLKTGLMAGAGFLVSGRSRIVQASTQDVGRRTAVPAAQAAALPAIIDPLYVAPILDPAAVPFTHHQAGQLGHLLQTWGHKLLLLQVKIRRNRISRIFCYTQIRYQCHYSLL